MRIRFDFSSRRTRRIDPHNRHRQGFITLAKEVIRVSDIIIEVLDARFLNKTRNAHLERMILSSHKQIIYALNKSDLVNVKELKSSDLVQGLNPHVFISSTQKTGGKKLRDHIKILSKRILKDPERQVKTEEEKLKKYRHGKGYETFLKTGDEVYVGIIGYPNVGKSSLINLLAGSGSAKVSPRSGFTKGIHKVRLADGIILLDTPGLITEEDAAATHSSRLAKHTLIGVRTHDTSKNPDFIVAEMMKEYPGILEEHYKIEANGDSEELLEKLGRRLNYIKKKDQVDTDRTARQILKDWQQGKIKFFEK